MDIASAKEVLSDEKMRRQFDQGEDPLDVGDVIGYLPPVTCLLNALALFFSRALISDPLLSMLPGGAPLKSNH
jgi:hypothetical protein